MQNATSPPDARRCIPVRLDRLPLDVRVDAARRACRTEVDPEARQELLFAAVMPSDRIYWVAP